MKDIRKTLLRLWSVWMWVCTLSVTFALIALTTFAFFDPWFFAIDSCLDRGGRWEYQENFCTRAN